MQIFSKKFALQHKKRNKRFLASRISQEAKNKVLLVLTAHFLPVGLLCFTFLTRILYF